MRRPSIIVRSRAELLEVLRSRPPGAFSLRVDTGCGIAVLDVPATPAVGDGEMARRPVRNGALQEATPIPASPPPQGSYFADPATPPVPANAQTQIAQIPVAQSVPLVSVGGAPASATRALVVDVTTKWVWIKKGIDAGFIKADPAADLEVQWAALIAASPASWWKQETTPAPQALPAPNVATWSPNVAAPTIQIQMTPQGTASNVPPLSYDFSGGNMGAVNQPQGKPTHQGIGTTMPVAAPQTPQVASMDFTLGNAPSLPPVASRTPSLDAVGPLPTGYGGTAPHEPAPVPSLPFTPPSSERSELPAFNVTEGATPASNAYVEKLLRVNVDPLADRIRKSLTLGEGRTEKRIVGQAIDDCSQMLEDATILWLKSKEDRARVEQEIAGLRSAMRSKANASLAADKDAGTFAKKTISNDDVEARMSEMYHDEYAAQESRVRLAKNTEYYFESLLDRVKRKNGDMNTIYSKFPAG